MNLDVLWPQDGDELFAVGQDWENNACVGFSAEQWHGYKEGYKRAADQLVASVAETGRNQDYLIYPIVFLYRHAIELSLKHLIIVGSKLLDEEPGKIGDHPLIPLWQKSRPLIERVWPEGPKEDLEAIEAVLEQFEARDRRSTAFRYPVDKSGQPSQMKNEQISIRNFSEVSTRVLALLESCQSGLDSYLQDKREMERAYEQEMQREMEQAYRREE
jgi:hypothetical protein